MCTAELFENRLSPAAVSRLAVLEVLQGNTALRSRVSCVVSVQYPVKRTLSNVPPASNRDADRRASQKAAQSWQDAVRCCFSSIGYAGMPLCSAKRHRLFTRHILVTHLHLFHTTPTNTPLVLFLALSRVYVVLCPRECRCRWACLYTCFSTRQVQPPNTWT